MAAKKSSKPGAVKYFNDKKAEAFKSAANAMKAFKKNMPKAQLGEEVENMLVNKPGSKGDYKKPTTSSKFDDLLKIYRGQGLDFENASKAALKSLKESPGYNDANLLDIKGGAKKGGAIKTKKKK